MSLDPVNHKDLKGKHKNAKDKDIDNDGEVDSSDEYLHKRRQAVSKAIGKIKEGMAEQAAGLWANIHAKRKRIEAGSGEKMRAPGSKGAPSADSLKRARSATESAEIKEEAYRKPTQAEIDADRKKDEKGKPRPSISAKSVMRKTYGNMMGGLKNEETELDEVSRDLVRRYIRKVADKTNTGELSTKQVMKRRPGVNLAGKKAYPGIAGEPKVRATESAEFKTEAKDGDGANIVRDREFKEPKFKFKSHPYGSPEWHANKAAHEKFKAKQAAQAAKKAMKNEEVEKKPTELPADKKPLRMKLAHFRHQE